MSSRKQNGTGAALTGVLSINVFRRLIHYLVNLCSEYQSHRLNEYVVLDRCFESVVGSLLLLVSLLQTCYSIFFIDEVSGIDRCGVSVLPL